MKTKPQNSQHDDANKAKEAPLCFRNLEVGLFGLGKSGLACAKALIQGGAILHAWDDSKDARARAAEIGIPLGDLNLEQPMRDCSFLVLAPGIPLEHPIANNARLWGKEIIGDIELAWRANPNIKVLAITGTNGKSTTTALLGHIFEKCGCRVQVGGNIGRPILELDTANSSEGVELVLELSSFQLDLIKKARFEVGILLNIAPDHLERYESMDAYIAAKTRIARNTKGKDILICGIDDEWSQRLFLAFSNQGLKTLPISAKNEAPSGVWVIGGRLYDDTQGATKVYDIPENKYLRGMHNAQNIAAAYTAAKCYQRITPQNIIESLKSFKGLEHRMLDLGTRAGILFINDSKATNPHATKHAIAACSDSNIFWLAGGRMKGGATWLQEIVELLATKPLVQEGFFFGEARDIFTSCFVNKFPCTSVATLKEAFNAAINAARKQVEKEDAVGEKGARKANRQPIILLSPSCASFDQFANHAERGKCFELLVKTFEADAISISKNQVAQI